MRRRSFIRSTIILMISGLLVRILGFVYRIYLSNLIGAEGMGLFQLISPVFSLIILTLSSGISIAVSRLVAAENVRGNVINTRRITNCALWLIVSLGTIVSIVLLFNVRYISNVILKDPRTYYSILLYIPCIPVIASASALKGYFYGLQEVAPTALSQIVEQIIRIGIVITMATQFIGKGLEYACAAATIGMTLGEVSNLLVLCIIYRRKNRKRVSQQGLKRRKVLLKEILAISVPVSFNRFTTSFMYTIETILIPRSLLKGGLNYQTSMIEFGKLTGMAMPLLYFPTIVTSSLATVLVPAISEAIAAKNYKILNYKISRSIQITVLLGFIFTAVFYSFPDIIGNVLYKNESIGDMLKILSYTCIFMYLQQTLIGTLNGLGKQALSLRHAIVGYIVRIGFVVFCMPYYGVNGYVWGTIASSVIVCILNLAAVTKTTGMIINLKNWVIKPLAVCMGMILCSPIIIEFLSVFQFKALITAALCVILQLGAALALIVVLDILSISEIIKFTGLNKIIKTPSNISKAVNHLDHLLM